MARTTGPVLATGGLAWLNQTILSDDSGSPTEEFWEPTLRIGVATGVLAAVMYGFEKVLPDAAVGVSYLALLTVLLVRMRGKPTPLERILKLAQ